MYCTYGTYERAAHTGIQRKLHLLNIYTHVHTSYGRCQVNVLFGCIKNFKNSLRINTVFQIFFLHCIVVYVEK